MVAYRRFPKLELVVDTATHRTPCGFATVGPVPDVASFCRLLFGTPGRTGMTTILADAEYDSEANHRFARDGCGMPGVIPAKHGRRTTKLSPTAHRRKMKGGSTGGHPAVAVVSLIKRNLDPVAARTAPTCSAEAML